jgi:hypothetical protein
VANWETISSLATGAGTLVLAVATFASVRSANRSARVAEVALQEQRRPVLVHSRIADETQKIAFRDQHWVRVPGGQAVIDVENDVIYFAMSLRNVGAGIAVLQAWRLHGETSAQVSSEVPDLEAFTRLSRDLYVPASDVGLWQAALRESGDDRRTEIEPFIAERQPFTVDLLYTDQLGDQRTVSRFGVFPAGDDVWLTGVGRHWFIDSAGTR